MLYIGLILHHYGTLFCLNMNVKLTLLMSFALSPCHNVTGVWVRTESTVVHT